MVARVKIIRQKDRPYECRWIDELTGKVRSRSTGTTHRRDAERFAARLEVELESGSLISRDVTWEEAVSLYESEVLAAWDPRSRDSFRTTWRCVEKCLAARLVKSLQSEHIARLVSYLRGKGRSEHTVYSHVERLRMFLTWCVRRGLLSRVPEFTVSVRPIHQPRGGPITEGQFNLLLDAVRQYAKAGEATMWLDFLRGLWLSGLRLNEAVRLSWDSGDFVIDTSREIPCFRISARGQKNRRMQLLPLTPDFWEFVKDRPRKGKVFKVPSASNPKTLTWKISSAISFFGKQSGVITASGRSVTAHDLRRSFGFRWASKVRAPVLMSLMRHHSLDTTMKFYLGSEADNLGREVWNVPLQG